MGHLIWYGLVALALTLSVGLFISAKAELDRLRRRADAERELWKRELENQQQQLDAIRAELREVAGQQRCSPLPATPVAINVSKRNHALRMCRGGQSPEEIAGSLGIPQDEVKLLLKVHQIVLDSV